MDLLLCWLVGPVLLLLVAVGLSFVVELISGARLPWCLRPALGLAVMMVMAQFGVRFDATAELTIPVIVALGAFGLVMGWSAELTRGPLPRLGARGGPGGLPRLRGSGAALGRADLGRLHKAGRHRHLDGDHRSRLRVRAPHRRLRPVHLGGADRLQRRLSGRLVRADGADLHADRPGRRLDGPALDGADGGRPVPAARRGAAPAPPRRARSGGRRLPRSAVGDAARLHALGGRQGGRRCRCCSLSRR